MRRIASADGNRSRLRKPYPRLSRSAMSVRRSQNGDVGLAAPPPFTGMAISRSWGAMDCARLFGNETSCLHKFQRRGAGAIRNRWPASRAESWGCGQQTNRVTAPVSHLRTGVIASTARPSLRNGANTTTEGMHSSMVQPLLRMSLVPSGSIQNQVCDLPGESCATISRHRQHCRAADIPATRPFR